MKIAIEIMGLPFWRVESRKDVEGNIIPKMNQIIINEVDSYSNNYNSYYLSKDGEVYVYGIYWRS